MVSLHQRVILDGGRGPRAASAGAAGARTRAIRWVALLSLGCLVGGLSAQESPSPTPVAETGSIFLDRGAETGLDFVHFNGMSGEFYFPEMTGAGAALLDWDGDGDLDAYLLQGHMMGPGKSLADAVFRPEHPEPFVDRLYRNDTHVDGDGQVELVWTDVTGTAGAGGTGYGMGVAAGDIDNDGWIDLYVTNFGSNKLLRNRGDGTFSDETEATGTDDPRWSVSASFLDFDRDGWLDLYVGNYVDFTYTIHRVCARTSGARDYCGPLAFEPVPDRLFRNRGDGTFEDVSSRAGIHREFGGALGIIAADFDGDGWVDIYVANDGVPNQLWINQRDGTFVDDALLAGCSVNRQGQPEASMGVDAADFDGDGDEDLFMAHLVGETNTLYLNDGTGVFSDHTQLSGLGSPSWSYTSFGTGWLDYDNDGRLDLFAVNGAVKTIEALASRHDPYPLHQPNQLFHNLGEGRFEDVSAAAGESFVASAVSRGAALGDVDNDGDNDLLVVNNAGPARLLVNQVGQESAWSGIRVTGTDGGRDLLGTRVRLIRSDGSTAWRRVKTDGSYASSHDPRIVVGRGAATTSGPESLLVVLPDGRRIRWDEPPGDRYLLLRTAAAVPIAPGGVEDR